VWVPRGRTPEFGAHRDETELGEAIFIVKNMHPKIYCDVLALFVGAGRLLAELTVNPVEVGEKVLHNVLFLMLDSGGGIGEHGQGDRIHAS
jgi:hypothetical protein